jgi:hypothetical protein
MELMYSLSVLLLQSLLNMLTMSHDVSAGIKMDVIILYDLFLPPVDRWSHTLVFNG